jgi:hypothetical protein
MASKYRSITEAVNYKLLAEALVLYKSRVRSIETIIDETSNEAKAEEYDAAYDQLLKALQYRANLSEAYQDVKQASRDQAWTARAELARHDNRIPGVDDLGVKCWSVRDAAHHLLALNSAVEFLETTLFIIELEVENRREEETPLDFIASQDLSSKALFQLMLRFAGYSEDASERHERAQKRYQTARDREEREHATAEMYDATESAVSWTSRMEKLAALMAKQVQNEEHDRRMPPVVQGADIGEEDLAEISDNEGTGDEMENLPPEEGNDDDVDQVEPNEKLGEGSLPCSESDNTRGASTAQSDHESTDFDVGTLSLDSTLAT